MGTAGLWGDPPGSSGAPGAARSRNASRLRSGKDTRLQIIGPNTTDMELGQLKGETESKILWKTAASDTASEIPKAENCDLNRVSVKRLIQAVRFMLNCLD